MEQYKKEDQIIGEGSFGKVYLIRNKQGERFAYKEVKVDPFQAEEAQLEIDIMKKFKHPNLVQIIQHHFDEEKEQLQIIMEYCEGGDLAHFIRNNKNRPAALILNILQQIVNAFVAMSAKGVMHRDLKPENILMTKNGTIKIADFGCAKCVDIHNISLIASRSIEKGTYLYASPEQLGMEKYSFKCDVWAAGCIAFLLEYGTHPFIESTPHNVLALIEKLTIGQSIPLLPATDPALATFITLTLINKDVERASWRQLQLSRIFGPRITNTEKYINHLRKLSPISNFIVKQFWRLRKNFSFLNSLDEIFVYYLIRFQMSNLKMCLKILKKAGVFRYLFEPIEFGKFEPKEETFNEIRKEYLEYQKYFTSIKKTMETKDFFTKYISQYESTRNSAFIDLDKSIRTGYKILLHLRTSLADSQFRDNKVWVIIARWINFEQHFNFELNPDLKALTSQPLGDVMKQINQGIELYQYGSCP